MLTLASSGAGARDRPDNDDAGSRSVCATSSLRSSAPMYDLVLRKCLHLEDSR